MASVGTYFDDVRVSPEVIDPARNEDNTEVIEHKGNHVQHSPKSNVATASNVRELLECPVCLNAMYPPIHQVSLFNIPSLEHYASLGLFMLLQLVVFFSSFFFLGLY